MTEVQQHGLIFESEVTQAITGLSKHEYQKLLPNAYINSMDIAQGIMSDCNYSIKVTNGRSVCCGDISRFMKHCRDDEFTIVVGEWKQAETIKRYSTVYEFHITPAHYSLLFAELTEQTLDPFVDYVKSIPHGRDGQLENEKTWKAKRDDLYNTNGRGLVSIDAKIDSKSQRRVQCSIKLKDLLMSEIVSNKYDIEYRGIPLPYESESNPRTFTRTGPILY